MPVIMRVSQWPMAIPVVCKLVSCVLFNRAECSVMDELDVAFCRGGQVSEDGLAWLLANVSELITGQC